MSTSRSKGGAGARRVTPPSRPGARSTTSRPVTRTIPTSTVKVVAVDRRETGRRLRYLKFTGASMVLLTVGRVTQLQVVDRDVLLAKGERQRVRETTIFADRGDILDRNGAPLAMSIRDWRLVADPKLIANPAATAQQILALLPENAIDPQWLTSRLAEPSRYAIIVNGIDDDLKDKIVSARIAGLYFEQRFRRENPAGDLARSIIGRVNTDHVGSSGLEKMLDQSLTGRNGVLISERGQSGVQIPGGKRTLQPAVSGKTYITTIDRSLQYACDGMLARQIAASGALGGMVVVSNPRTGEVLALSNMEVTVEGEIRSTGRNSAVVDVFEPGSTNKVITMAAALEDKVLTPQSDLIVPDHLQVGDHRFKDDVGHPTMRWKLRDILVNSSNIGTIKVAAKVNRRRYDRYLRAFGLGHKTAIDFLGESNGILLPVNRWNSTSPGAVPIGQGLSVTAMQMLSVFNTIANGGTRMPMRIISSTVDDRGREVPFDPNEKGVRVHSKQTADEITSMLVDVVKRGTGVGAQVAGYNVAGKTGTAQKPNVGKRGYKPGAYVASFAGYFPAEDPKLSIIVVLDEPKTPNYYGGVVAAPLFAEVARWAGQHYRIAPSGATNLSLKVEASAAFNREAKALTASMEWQRAIIRKNALPSAGSLAKVASSEPVIVERTTPTDNAPGNEPLTAPITTVQPIAPTRPRTATPTPDLHVTPSTRPHVRVTIPPPVTSESSASPPPSSLPAPSVPAATAPPQQTIAPTTEKPRSTAPDLSTKKRTVARARVTVPPTRPPQSTVPVASAPNQASAADSGTSVDSGAAVVAVARPAVQTVEGESN